MTPHAYWVATLRPWAQAGYRHGTVDDEAILLRNEATGDVVLLPRPSSSWVAASVLLPAFDDDHDPEALRGVRYVMERGNDRVELLA
jgi:hypothetical protein